MVVDRADIGNLASSCTSDGDAGNRGSRRLKQRGKLRHWGGLFLYDPAGTNQQKGARKRGTILYNY